MIVYVYSFVIDTVCREIDSNTIYSMYMNSMNMYGGVSRVSITGYANVYIY